MMLRKSVSMAAGFALIAPAVAVAQPTAFVTVAPVGTPAPALDVSLLVLLALSLTVVTVARLRRLSPAVRAAACALAIAGMTATAAYSTGATVLISGTSCFETVKLAYTPSGRQVLGSECANPVKIVDLEVQCDVPGEALGETPVGCEIGLTLELGDECFLYTCDT